MCDAIFIGNTHQTPNKIMDRHFYDLVRLLKNGQKSDSFSAHFKQHFNATTPHTYLRIYTTFKVVKQLNSIREMKTFTKPNCNLCMEECLTIVKTLHDKHVTVINKNFDIYGACRHNTTFHPFFPDH